MSYKIDSDDLIRFLTDARNQIKENFRIKKEITPDYRFMYAHAGTISAFTLLIEEIKDEKLNFHLK